MLKYIFLVTTFLLFVACSNDANTTSTDNASALSITRATSATTPISIFQTLSIEFSSELDINSVNETTIILEDSTGSVVGSNIELITPANTKIVITPYTYLEPSQTYTLTITTGIKDNAGLSLSTDYELSFTTDNEVVDTTPLLFERFKPEMGVTQYSNTDLTIEFNKFIAPVSASADVINVTCDGSNVDGSVEFFNSTITFKPTNPLPDNLPCYFNILSGITDMYGNAYDIGSTNNIQIDINSTISQNLGYKKLLTLSTGKTSSFIRTMPAVGDGDTALAVARVGGIDFYKITSDSGTGYIPTLSLMFSYDIPSQINDMQVVGNDVLLVGTMSDGVYVFLIDDLGNLDLKSHEVISDAIYGISGGYNDTTGDFEKLYAVGPDYGLGIFDINNTAYTMTFVNKVTKTNSAFLKVLQAKDKTGNTPYTSKLFVVDYDNGVVMYDADGTNAINMDMNGSYKNILVDYSYSSGDINYMKVTNSIGIGSSFNYFNNAILETNYINLPSSALDIGNDYQSDLSRSRNYYAMSDKGLFIEDKDNVKHLINTGGSVVSAAHVYKYLANAQDQQYYLATLDLDGTINIFNAVSDVTAPIFQGSLPMDGETSASTTNPITIKLDEFVNVDSLINAVALKDDGNNSVGLTFSSIDYTSSYPIVKYVFTLDSPLSGGTGYTLSCDGIVEDIVGNVIVSPPTVSFTTI